MRKVKVAVVGLNRGGILARHILNYCRDFELTAVCDIVKEKADKFAADNNIQNVYYSIDELLKSDVEAVVLATPIPCHSQHVVQVLEAKKHVLSEVTSAVSLDGCREIADAVKKSGMKYMMEENYCYYRPLTVAQKMIDAGLFGDIYYAESDYLMDFRLRSGFPEKLQPWRREVYFGRKGHPYITHSLGPLAFTMKDKIKTVCCMGAGTFEGLTADKTCALLCKTEKGGLIRLRNSFISARPDMYTYYSFQGTKGCYQGAVGKGDMHKVHIRDNFGSNEWRSLYDFKGFLPKEWDIFPKGHFDEADRSDDGTSWYDSGAPLLLEEFAKSILNGTKPPITAEMALNWTAAGLVSETSALNGGEPIEVPDFGL